jgi:hypothetical protein
MSESKHLRKRLFVDPKVQGALVLRVLLYWVTCLVTVSMMLLCWWMLTGPARLFYTQFDDLWIQYGPAMVASLLLLPMVILDVLRLSNRFVGPLLRLRRGMRALAQGEQVEPIEFRDGDFWQDFAQEFNALAAYVGELKAAARDGKPVGDEEAAFELAVAD